MNYLYLNKIILKNNIKYVYSNNKVNPKLSYWSRKYIYIFLWEFVLSFISKDQFDIKIFEKNGAKLKAPAGNFNNIS